MKVEAKKIVDFLNCVTFGGGLAGVTLKFDVEGLKVGYKSTDNISASVGLMKKTLFQDYEETEYSIKNIDKFTRLLELFPGQIDLKKQENMLIISGNVDDKHSRKVSYVLASPEFIENDLKGPLPGKFDNGFIVSKKIFSDAIKSFTILKAEKVIFQVKDKIFNLVVGEDNFDHITESMQVEYKDVETTIGNIFLKIVPVLSDKVTVAFENNYPIQFLVKTEDYDAKLLVAPIIEKE